MIKKVFVALILSFSFLCADDVKVKLNSADGSTSFQVLDSNEVVVATVTSKGDATFSTVIITATHSGALNISAGAVSDRSIKNEDLQVTSTYTLITDWYDATNTISDTDILGMYGTITVSAAPATIFIFGNVTGNGKAGKTFTYKAVINGTTVGQSKYKPDASDTTDLNQSVGVVGALRVTSTGNYVVKLQYTTDDATQDIWIGERNIMAFVLGSP